MRAVTKQMVCSAGLSSWLMSSSAHCAAPSEPPGWQTLSPEQGSIRGVLMPAIADVAIYRIRTLGAAKRQQPSADLDEPLRIVEIADPMSASMTSDMCTSAMAHCTYSHAARCAFF
jgi:hypothetical protein